MQIRRDSTFLYAGLFLLLILVILIGNALFLIDRTSSNLIEIYWKQGELVVDSIAASAQQSVDSLKLTELQIRRNIKKVVIHIDELIDPRGNIPRQQLKRISEKYQLSAIHIFDLEGNLVAEYPDKLAIFDEPHDGKNRPTSGIIKTLSFDRSDGNGRIVITIDEEKLTEIRIGIGLQLFIASLENRNIIQHLTFLNEEQRIIAASDISRIGFTEEKQEYFDALESDVSYFFLNENVMDIIQSMTFVDETRGVFKIGFPTTEINRIYRNTVNNAIVFSSWFMLIAIITVAVILKWRLSYITRMEAMKKRIQENEKLVSLSNLAAGVAHEVRNPLNSISITIQRLQLEFTPAEEEIEEYQALTKVMKNEVDRINKIITDFLGFSKPFTPKRAVFSITEFLEESLILFMAEAKEKKVAVAKQFNHHSDEFFGDREKLTQVLLNILHNALEANEEGSRMVLNSKVSKNGNWSFQVEDEGEKISQEKLNRVFDIYYTTKQNGTGLGLYISRKIITAHHGTIELVPNSPKGVISKVELPSGKDEKQ